MGKQLCAGKGYLKVRGEMVECSGVISRIKNSQTGEETDQGMDKPLELAMTGSNKEIITSNEKDHEKTVTSHGRAGHFYFDPHPGSRP
jgi:hypothetical protein